MGQFCNLFAALLEAHCHKQKSRADFSLGGTMTTIEILTLIAIVTGPIAAVLITLWIDGRRRRRDARLIVARMMMSTRQIPADPGWQTAINLLRVEFAKDRDVIAALLDYHTAARKERASSDERQRAQDDELKARQAKLVSAVLKAVGLDVKESDLLLEAYVSDGFVMRDNLAINSQIAQLRIAKALEHSVGLPEEPDDPKRSAIEAPPN